jgi:hypothetical protein
MLFLLVDSSFSDSAAPDLGARRVSAFFASIGLIHRGFGPALDQQAHSPYRSFYDFLNLPPLLRGDGF